jgi:nitrile hydratase
MKRPAKRKTARKAAPKKAAPAAKRRVVKTAGKTRATKIVAKRSPVRQSGGARRPASAPAIRHEVGPTADPLFKVGEAVMIVISHPPGHRRTPFYIRGKTGTIERYCGAYRNPEELAYGFDGFPRRHLYRVRFRQADIWPNYQGPAQDVLELEIFEHWLHRA